jgi:hypothetical protein
MARLRQRAKQQFADANAADLGSNFQPDADSAANHADRDATARRDILRHFATRTADEPARSGVNDDAGGADATARGFDADRHDRRPD